MRIRTGNQWVPDPSARPCRFSSSDFLLGRCHGTPGSIFVGCGFGSLFLIQKFPRIKSDITCERDMNTRASLCISLLCWYLDLSWKRGLQYPTYMWRSHLWCGSYWELLTFNVIRIKDIKHSGILALLPVTGWCRQETWHVMNWWGRFHVFIILILLKKLHLRHG